MANKKVAVKFLPSGKVYVRAVTMEISTPVVSIKGIFFPLHGMRLIGTYGAGDAVVDLYERAEPVNHPKW